MNLDEFYHQIGTARWCAAQLYYKARKSFVQQQELLVECFEQLYAALEELQVAQEELRQQNENLAAAHEVMEEERQRYRDLLEFTSDAYLVSDGKGIIRETNRAAARLLNVPQRFLVGKPLAIFISREKRRAFITELTRLHQQNRGQEWEVPLQPRNGEPIDVTLTLTTVQRGEGKQIVVGWLLRGIPERK